MNTVIERIKEKYPAYAEVPDDELTQRIAQKHPSYLDIPDFKADFERIGRKSIMQKQMANERTDHLAGEIAETVLTGAEGVVSKIAAPIASVLQIPENIARMAGMENVPSAIPPALSKETALKGVEFMTPGGAASEGTVGKAAQELVAEFASGATTPTMVAGVLAAPAAPVGIARVFQAEMLSQVPAGIKAAVEAPTGSEGTKAVLATAANLLLPAAIERGITAPAAKAAVIESAAKVGPATEAVVKGKEAVETPPQPSVAPVATTGELVKPVAAEQPATTEPPLPSVSTTPAKRQTGVEPTEAPKAPEAGKAELVGLGAATPAEFALSQGSPTGIKNRTVDAELVKMDLPPLMDAGRQAFGEAWDRGMARMDKDPSTGTHKGYQDKLIAELENKPRPATDVEVAVLTHRKNELRLEYNRAIRDVAQAADDGRIEDLALEQVRLGEISDKLQDFSNLTQAVGTEQGRGLAARKMMVNEDFTLATMELEKRAAKGGESLTVEERNHVIDLQKKIETTQKAYDDYVAKTQQQMSALEVKAALTAATQKAQANVPPKVLEIAKRIADNLHREANAARERIKERGIMFGSGPLHEIPNIKDFAIIGADHIVTGTVKFAEWSGKMVKEFGEGIRPHLKTIFDASNKEVNAIDQKSPYVQPVRRAKAKQDPQAVKLSFEATKAKKEWKQNLQQERAKGATPLSKVFSTSGKSLDLARALMTTGEFSAVLKQGGFTGLGNPIRALKAFPAMFKALGSEQGMHAVNMEIASRPNYPLYVRSRLFLSEQGHALSKMEEATMSQWAEKIPGLRGFQRSHPTFLNKLRADSFDALANTLVRRGEELTPERADALSDFINISTGRATFGKIEKNKSALEAFANMNRLFFAPRWVASRIQLATGVPMWRALRSKDPAIIRIVAEEYGKFLAGLGVVYGLWKSAGGDIGTDPNSTDFGKIKVGGTTVDLMAGLQQPLVFATRLITGEKTTNKGKTVPIRGEKVPYGGEDTFDVATRFLRTKLAPVPASAVDVATGKDVVGKEATIASELKELAIPLTYRDIYTAMREQGVEKGTALALLAMFGAGISTRE